MWVIFFVTYVVDTYSPSEAFALRSEVILRAPLTHIHVLIGGDTVPVSPLRA
uniref:hypothetical protein n=1 Tax=Marinobacterium profundum TaxID=1714300 RepID=UPI000A6775D0|nr:hypothetical protein [Marinobacterium profundum]